MDEDGDEVVLALPAHVIQSIARGEAMAVDVEDLGVRIVLICTDEAVEEFRNAVHAAVLAHLSPAGGVH